MNWYNKLKFGYNKLKLSQRLDRPKNYNEIGHYFWRSRQIPPDTEEIIWLIDKNWKLHTKRYDPTDTSSFQIHLNYFKNEYWDSIATGRAVLGPKDRISSLKLTNFGNSSHQKEFLIKKVERIIEREFKVDTIHIFDL